MSLVWVTSPLNYITTYAYLYIFKYNIYILLQYSKRVIVTPADYPRLFYPKTIPGPTESFPPSFSLICSAVLEINLHRQTDIHLLYSQRVIVTPAVYPRLFQPKTIPTPTGSFPPSFSLICSAVLEINLYIQTYIHLLYSERVIVTPAVYPPLIQPKTIPRPTGSFPPNFS